MHEMSLAEGIIQIIEEQSTVQNFSMVTMVHLDIGKLSHIEVDSMRFCFEAVCKDTMVEGAILQISESPGIGWCMDCARKIEYPALYEPCLHCHGHKIQITSGNEMLIKELEVR
ncbi:MAG: hydrogenase maturation nickel metallochaperone HypA [Colwellia sp.]|nr:hydrogenase maturation nickel metallochaperone HypA [Colwellia sp.]